MGSARAMEKAGMHCVKSDYGTEFEGNWSHRQHYDRLIDFIQPGLGIDINEEIASRYPFPDHPLSGAWPPVRRLDGTVIRP